MSLGSGQGYGADDGVMDDRLEQMVGSAFAPLAWWVDHVLAPVRADIRSRDPHMQVYSDEAVQGMANIWGRSCHTRASIMAGRGLDVSELHTVTGFLEAGLLMTVAPLGVAALRQRLRPVREQTARRNRLVAAQAARRELANTRQLALRYDFWLEQPFSADLSQLEACFWTAEKTIIGCGL